MNTVSYALMIPLVAIVGGLSFAVICVVASTLKSISSRKQREQTRREIAAYVAEGSMTPDDAERILKADPKSTTKD